MVTRAFNPRTQRGTVLVTVLMMFAISAAIATEMAYRQKLDIRRTSAMLLVTQGREYLFSAEELAMLGLREDQKQDERDKSMTDHLKEDWAIKRPPLPVDGGAIQGKLLDAQGRFNVNCLVKPGAEDIKWVVNPPCKQAFLQLLGLVQMPRDGSPEVLADRLIDWLDSDDIPTGNDGMEDTEYLRLERPRKTANQPIRDTTELKSVEGFDSDTFDALVPYISALPPGASINVNTASKEVLSLIPGMKADELVAARVNDPLKSVEDVRARFVTAGSQGAGQDAPPDDTEAGEDAGEGGTGEGSADPVPFDVFSEFFELQSKVALAERSFLSRSVIYRPQKAAANGDKLKVIYRAFVDPLQQPLDTTTPNNGQTQ